MSTSSDLGYLIPKLFGDPGYNTGPGPDDRSLASRYVRDLLLRQEGPIDLMDLRDVAFALGREEGSTSPIRQVSFTQEGIANFKQEVRVDDNGNVRWAAEAFNTGYGTGPFPGGNTASGSAICTGYFYYLPSDGTILRLTGRHLCTGKGQGISGRGFTTWKVFAFDDGYMSGRRKDLYQTEIADDTVGKVERIFARFALDPLYPYVCISFEVSHSGGGGSNAGIANAPGQRAEIYEVEAEFLG